MAIRIVRIYQHEANKYIITSNDEHIQSNLLPVTRYLTNARDCDLAVEMA
jgi:hypothetical protein